MYRPERKGGNKFGKDGKPFRKKEFGTSGGSERKPFRGHDSENKEGTERKPYPKRDLESGESKERKSYKRRDSENSEGRERRPYPKRDYGRSGTSRPFNRRGSSSNEKIEIKTFPRIDAEGNEGNERKPFLRRDSERGESFENRPYQKRTSGASNRGERKPFRKKEYVRSAGNRGGRSGGTKVRLKLYIEYEGTRYSGWQIQQNAKSVQGKILEAAEIVFGREIGEFKGSGRTDSGVHAMCQVAHLEVVTMLAPEIIRMKLNDELPSDINILEVEKVDFKFHARHDAESRSYIYQISKRRSAFAKSFVWWVKDKLDVEKMKEAAGHFVGMHDFASFADKDEVEKSTKVLLQDVQLKDEGDLILIRISGSHFLWKMVRRMVGVLVEVGRGNLDVKDIDRFLESYSNEPAKFTAPPSGLFLENISYTKEKSSDAVKSFITVNPFKEKK